MAMSQYKYSVRPLDFLYVCCCSRRQVDLHNDVLKPGTLTFQDCVSGARLSCLSTNIEGCLGFVWVWLFCSREANFSYTMNFDTVYQLGGIVRT